MRYFLLIATISQTPTSQQQIGSRQKLKSIGTMRAIYRFKRRSINMGHKIKGYFWDKEGKKPASEEKGYKGKG